MKTSKNKCLVPALILTFFGVLLIGIVIVVGIVFFNEKTIVVPDDELTIQDAVDVAVEGDIILVKADGGPYEEVTITTDNIKLIGIGKVKPVLDGMNVQSDGITLTSGGVLVKNFIVKNFTNNGILVDSSDGNMIKGNNVNENDARGITLDSSASNMIKGNNVNKNGTRGILLIDDSADNMIKGNNVNQNVERGIFLEDSSSNMIKGNNLHLNVDRGITLEDSVDNMINGNNVSESLRGIQLNTSDDNMINGNNVNENGARGIFLSDSDNNSIKGNTVNDNGNDGILLDANTNDNDVFFNRAFGNGNFDIRDQNVTIPLNNFKGNKCDMSDPAVICN